MFGHHKKILVPTDIPLLGCLRCQAINLALPNWYSLGGRPLETKPTLFTDLPGKSVKDSGINHCCLNSLYGFNLFWVGGNTSLCLCCCFEPPIKLVGRDN